MPIQPTPIQHRKLSDEVANQIEAMIHSGALGAGDELPPGRELMKLFGVGRPAIREALFSLEKMGLVAVTNGARARVTRPTPAAVFNSLSGVARHLLAQPDGIAHFQDARLFFEIGLTRRAAQVATKADIEALANALAANENALGDPAAFERTDVAFHYSLALIARNPIFIAIHNAIVEWLTEQRHTVLELPDADKSCFRSHKKIFLAVAGRDPDAGERTMRDHLVDVSKKYWRVRRQHDETEER